ncbi:spore germination protein [Gorillibacterium sp. sgz5001074]|uniref:spore germination protein n=1 Tax=Gorillibacterium sp. sgz5001074 TaxID=3446695 RepID=UPI003F674DC0
MGISRTIRKVMGPHRSTSSDGKDNPPSSVPLTGRLEQDLEEVRHAFRLSTDIMIREIELGSQEVCRAAIVYADGLVDGAAVQHSILAALMWTPEKREASGQASRTSEPPSPSDWIKNRIITIGNLKEVRDLETLATLVMSGFTVVMADGMQAAIGADTCGWEDREVSEPMSQTVVRGPREGFTETLRTNIALVRRKIKDSRLACQRMQIGRVTKTSVAIMFIEGIANTKVVEEVRKRLDRIDVDGILESGNVEEWIQDENVTPFPTVYNTERPDSVAACLLEGRVAILVDGTPFVLVVPFLFIQSLQSSEDYYQRADISTFLRLLRLVCFFIALLLPSLYIAVTTFHQEMLPTPLLISLAAQREGIPFPAFIEAFIMEVTFEILREAGVRMPRAIGQAVSIVGALVIGQAAVEAGIISASMVIVVSLTAISNFVFPSVNLAISVRLLRFVMMGLAGSFGLYGITLGLLALLLHLTSLRSFGVPYMAPFGPYVAEDQKDAILRVPFWGLISRPRLISQKNVIRTGAGPKHKKS